jgi:rod shape-determining protein MreC
MQRIIEFVVRFKNYIALCSLVVMSFSIISFGNLSKMGGFRAITVGSIGWIQSLFAWIPNPVALKSENIALRELNLQLSIESAKSRQAMVENVTLRKMLELPAYTDYQLIAADVIGKTTTQQRNYATINRGSNDGVREGMCCITDAGIVGIVIGTSPRNAVLQLLLNRDTKISAKDQRSRVDGIITWEGEQFLTMKDVPRALDVQAGDVVITSTYSTKYPANIVIGRITQVTEQPNTLFRRIVVEPAVNFATVEQVFVVNTGNSTERDSLERSIEEQLRARAR